MFDAHAGQSELDGVVQRAQQLVAQHRTDDPSVDAVLWFDPALGIDRTVLAYALVDRQNWTRRYLKPLCRMLSLSLVFVLTVLKRLLFFVGRFSWHSAIDVLCIWFMRRFVSPEAAYLLIRHFVVETNLANFVIRNVNRHTQSQIPTLSLRPDALALMGNKTVIQHDFNIYNFLIALGQTLEEKKQKIPTLRREQLDFQDVHVPPINVERERGRYLNLDIESALYLMNIPFCLFTTAREYERAVNSFQLDESLLGLLATLTGDGRFRSWTPLKFPIWQTTNRDVARDLFWHAVVNELAHTRLLAIQRGE